MNLHLNNLSIRGKLRLFSLAICFILTVFFLVSVWKSTNDSVRVDVKEQLNEDLLQFNIAEQDRLKENLLAGKDIAESSPAADILRSGDAAALCSWGKTLVGQPGLAPKHRSRGDNPAHIDLISLVYPDGRSMGFVTRPNKIATCESRTGEERFPAPKDKTQPELTDWESHADPLYELVQLPVEEPPGHYLGRLVIGFEVDSRLANRIANLDERKARTAPGQPLPAQTLHVVLWHLEDPDPKSNERAIHVLGISGDDLAPRSEINPDSFTDIMGERYKKDPLLASDFDYKSYRLLTENFGAASKAFFDNPEHVRITVIQDTRPKMVQFHHLELFMVLLGALGMALGLIFGTIFAHPIAEPLTELASVADFVAKGNLDHAQSLIASDKRSGATDEIGVLERSFKHMVRGLKERLAMSTFLSQATYEHICGEALDGSGENAAVRTSLALMFSDIRKFTDFSETESPETVIALLNEVLSIQAEIVERHNGDINKFIGDAVFAWFAGKDRCDRVVAASLEIAQALEDRFHNSPGTQVGIGIHLGELVVGSVGSPNRKDYTAIGGVVNRTARMCSRAEAGQILVSAEVAAELGPQFTLTALEPILLKGITGPVPIFAVNRPALPPH